MSLVPAFLQTRRWFLGKGRTILNINVIDVVQIPNTAANLGLVRVEYAEGDPDIYLMPGSVATGEAANKLLAETPDVVFARIHAKDGEYGVLYSAFWDPKFGEALLGAITKRRRIRGRGGELVGSHTRAFRRIWGPDRPLLEPSVLRADQRNTSVAYGDRFVLKLFRRVEAGTNPEVDISTFLSEHGFKNTPPVAGTIEYRPAAGEAMSIGILHGFVPNQGSAWRFTLDTLGRFFEQALTHSERLPPTTLLPSPTDVPDAVHDLMGEYAEAARVAEQPRCTWCSRPGRRPSSLPSRSPTITVRACITPSWERPAEC
jgi:maltose alpha-D-glucosyltransferase/alpha-amylase